MESGAVISRGYNYCTALETALKLGETSYIQIRGYSAADFMHGPVAVGPRGLSVHSDRAARQDVRTMRRDGRAAAGVQGGTR